MDNNLARRRVAALLAAALLGAVLIGARLGSHPLWDPDEAKHAEAAREMLLDGRWLEPTVNFEPYHHKPSSLYVVIAAAYRVFGVNEVGARAVSALCAWLTLLLVCAYGSRKSPLEGLFATLLLSACALFVLVGRFTNFDAALTLFSTSAVLALARLVEDRSRSRDALVFYVSLALAVLVKGPVALALLIVPIVVALLLGDLELADLRLVPGVSIAGSILGLWLVPALIYAPDYVAEFFWVHNVQRYLAPDGAGVFHPQPFWFFVPVLAGALLPWSPWLPNAVIDALGERAERSARVLATYALWVMVFFSISSGKLATYILPAVPALALLVSRWLVRERNDRGAGRLGLVFAGCTCAVLAPAACLYLRYEAAELVAYGSVFLPVSLAGGGVVALRKRLVPFRGAVVLCSAMVVSVFAFNVFAAKPVSSLVSDADLAAVARQYGRPQRVIAYRVRPYSFLFYTGWRLDYRVPVDEVRAALYEPGGALLLSEDRWLFYLEEAALGVRFRELARNPRHVLYEVRSPWG